MTLLLLFPFYFYLQRLSFFFSSLFSVMFFFSFCYDHKTISSVKLFIRHFATASDFPALKDLLNLSYFPIDMHIVNIRYFALK